jgi:catechol 2,3-dioxygenase-like lactoylglutathione lyase family enzyme
MPEEIAMELHRGRLIDHVRLRARDLKASQRFYAAILGALGIPVVSDDRHLAADELWIDAGDQSSHVGGLLKHVPFGWNQPNGICLLQHLTPVRAFPV